MSNSQIIKNQFDPRTTKTVIIHDGRFHADDMMFAALAIIASEKYRNKVNIIRTSIIPQEYDKYTIAGDVGFGIYDHHTDIDGTQALGLSENTEDRQVAACGLLYHEIKDILFPGNSETKSVFGAFIDIIEHCDNTPDNNTFSDSVNFLTPINDADMDEKATLAISYCKSVINGFISAHEKEQSGKTWAVPRVCGGIVPGIEEKRESRYWKASNQTKNKYKYVSFNNKMNLKLRSMDTYSLACGVLNQRTRQYWRDVIESNDMAQITEMDRRISEEWPQALSSMKNRTIILDNYIPYGTYVKDILALFVILPSQRGGYTVTTLKTSNGKYRFDPSLLMTCDGCSFVANDKRFVFFDTKENAIKAAYAAGQAVEEYIKNCGFNAYRDIYGGCAYGYTGDLYQDLISEDIALNMYVRDFVKDTKNISINEWRALQVAVMDNPYLIHSLCRHILFTDEYIQWNFDVSVLDVPNLNANTLWTKNVNNKSWNFGLDKYMTTIEWQRTFNIVFPNPLPAKD